MKKKTPHIVLTCILMLLISCQTKQYEVVITLEEHTLNNELVRFSLPDSVHAGEDEWELFSDVNETIMPAQRINDSQAVFILDKEIQEHGSHTFRLKTVKRIQAGMQTEMQDGNMHLKSAEKEILTYHISTDCPDTTYPGYYCRSGFIHPVYSPGGAILTDGFPMGHMHQHGLFMAWTNTRFRGEFTDFWNQQKERGTALHKALISTTSGSVFCGFKAELKQVSLMHGPVLEEKWDVKAYDFGDNYIIDLVSNQKNTTNDTLFLNKHTYGGFGLRGSKLWNADDTIHFVKEAEFVTSEGLTGDSANHTRPLWTAIYGETENGLAGIAVLDHPENFRHPQYTRVHPKMPYFSITPIVDTSAFFAPGAEYSWKYRVVTFDGQPDTAILNALWEDYANPLVF